jgi:hypothetical protein
MRKVRGYTISPFDKVPPYGANHKGYTHMLKDDTLAARELQPSEFIDVLDRERARNITNNLKQNFGWNVQVRGSCIYRVS